MWLDQHPPLITRPIRSPCGQRKIHCGFEGMVVVKKEPPSHCSLQAGRRQVNFHVQCLFRWSRNGRYCWELGYCSETDRIGQLADWHVLQTRIKTIQGRKSTSAGINESAESGRQEVDSSKAKHQEGVRERVQGLRGDPSTDEPFQTPPAIVHPRPHPFRGTAPEWDNPRTDALCPGKLPMQNLFG